MLNCRIWHPEHLCIYMKEVVDFMLHADVKAPNNAMVCVILGIRHYLLELQGLLVHYMARHIVPCQLRRVLHKQMLGHFPNRFQCLSLLHPSVGAVAALLYRYSHRLSQNTQQPIQRTSVVHT